jgi:hypothetical protein
MGYTGLFVASFAGLGTYLKSAMVVHREDKKILAIVKISRYSFPQFYSVFIGYCPLWAIVGSS